MPVNRRAHTQLLIHHGSAHPISAVFGLRYLHVLMRRWAHRGLGPCKPQSRHGSRWNGNWGEWGFDGQNRWS
jgi:hypothetical protein